MLNDHHSPITPTEYLHMRAEPVVQFYQRRLPRYARFRAYSTTALLAGSVGGTLMAFFGLASWTAVVTAVTSAVTAWSAFHGTDRKLSRYSNTVDRINSLILWWAHLTDVDKASMSSIERLVITCEDLFERERESWLSTSMSSKLLAQASEDAAEEDSEGGGGSGGNAEKRPVGNG
eukprot:g5275.t1